MTTYIHTGDGVAGTDVSASTPAGSDSFSAFVLGAASSLKYDDTYAISAGSSMKFIGAGGQSCYARWPYGAPTQALRFYIYFESLPTLSAATFWQCANASATRILGIAVSTTGYISTTDSSGVAQNLTPWQLSVGIWYRFEVVVDTLTGAWTLDIYEAHGDTPVASDQNASATFASAPDRHHFGKYSTTADAVFWIDEVVLETNSTVPIGPIPVAEAHYLLTGNYPPDSSIRSGWTIDARASTGEVTLVPAPFTPALVITESPAKVFTITDDGGTVPLQYGLVATSGEFTDSKTIDIVRSVSVGSSSKFRYTFLGGDPTLPANWA